MFPEMVSRFNEVIISAAPGIKWLANSQPELDLNNIKEILSFVKFAKDKRCILISTIDVLPPGIQFDENSNVSLDQESAYGRNRAFLELELRKFIQDLYIIRLPGLFGPGLKKNLLFDLKNRNRVQKLNPKSMFQYYDIRDLPAAISLAVSQGVHSLNLATEPISVREIYKCISGIEPPYDDSPKIEYKMESKYVFEISGRHERYHKSSVEVLSSINTWVKNDK